MFTLPRSFHSRCWSKYHAVSAWMYASTWNCSSNCSKKMPFINSHRVGCLAVFTSHCSVTMRYLMTPESLIRVLTP